MSGRRRGALALVALLLGGVLALPGCAVACPAIGYLNTVTLDARAYPDVEAVQFCIETECTPAPGESGDAGSLLGVTRLEDGEWSLMLDMRAPEQIVVRLFDADGVVIHESEEPISWTFTGGQCPGPATAAVVVVD